MKKNLLCALCVLLSAACLTTAALAVETYRNISELYQHWSMTKMPDWVCSVVSADGGADRLAVVVTSQTAAEELAAMVEDTSSMEVIVADSSYGYNELLQVQEDISKEYLRADGNGPVVSIGTGLAVIDGEVVGFGESGKELRVVVGVLAEYAEEYRELFRKQYGDMVYVQATEGIVLTQDMEIREQLPLATAPHTWYLWGIAALLCAAAAVIAWRQHGAVVQTADGSVSAFGRRMKRQRVEQQVIEGAQSPDEQVYRELRKKLEEKD